MTPYAQNDFDRKIERIRADGAETARLLNRRPSFLERYAVIPLAIGAGLAGIVLYSVGFFA